MANIIERIPKNFRVIYWIKPSGKVDLVSTDIVKILELITKTIGLKENSINSLEFENGSKIIVSSGKESTLFLSYFADKGLINIEFFTFSNISKETITKAISKVFRDTAWIRTQYLQL